jgi:hypothetical protein
MDDTIDSSIVFAKTPKGVAEINSRSGALSLQARRVLIMIDGRRPVAELLAVVRTGEFDGIISTLETQNMIEKVDLSSLPQRDLEEEDFADTISLLQENAAALRSVPHINPASLAPQTIAPQPVASQPVAPQTIQGRPPTIGGTPQNLGGTPQNLDASADAALIAARAVATASAPRPIEPPAVRRPPTLSAALSNNDIAPGTSRPGTLNGAMRVPEPVRQRPPTLTGARPATISAPVQEHAVAVAEAPVRAAAPARAEPEQAPAAAPAPAPAAAAPTRTLEEEKRFAVSELYSVLGPYGEQPVAKLQECSTLEALREQIKQAGKRVATFRGEKAAQDFLRTMGQA